MNVEEGTRSESGKHPNRQQEYADDPYLCSFVDAFHIWFSFDVITSSTKFTILLSVRIRDTNSDTTCFVYPVLSFTLVLGVCVCSGRKDPE